MYHLPVARAFAASGAMPALPDLRYPVFPQLVELLDASELLVDGDVLTPLTSLLFCLLVAALLVAWGRRLGDLRAGAWSAALWLGSPFVLLLARSGLTSSRRPRPSRRRLWSRCRLRWTAAAPPGSPTSGALARLGGRDQVHGPLLRRRARVSRRSFSVRAAPASAGRQPSPSARSRREAPGTLRNVLVSGNPVWPFLGGRLRLPVLGPDRRGVGDLESPPRGRPAEPPGAARAALESGHGPIAGHPQPRSGALRALSDRRRRGAWRRGSRRWLVLVAAGFVVFWFATTQQVRFLIPAIPAVCLLTAGAISRLADRFLPLPRATATAVLTSAAVVLGIALVPRDIAGKILRREIPPVNEASRADYFASRLPSYPLYRRLNAEHGGRYTIYAFHDETMKYFCEGRHLGDWFGPASYGRMDLSSGSRSPSESPEARRGPFARQRLVLPDGAAAGRRLRGSLRGDLPRAARFAPSASADRRLRPQGRGQSATSTKSSSIVIARSARPAADASSGTFRCSSSRSASGRRVWGPVKRLRSTQNAIWHSGPDGPEGRPELGVQRGVPEVHEEEKAVVDGGEFPVPPGELVPLGPRRFRNEASEAAVPGVEVHEEADEVQLVEMHGSRAAQILREDSGA